MPRWNVLVVEDDITYRTALMKYLTGRFEVTAASTMIQAIQCLKQQSYNLVLVDLILPDGHGFDLMKHIRRVQPDVQMIVITGQGTVETAVKAIQRGAFHYLMKPFSMDRLDQLIREAQKQAGVGVTLAQQDLQKKYQFDGIIGVAPAMIEVYKLVEKVAKSDSTILVRGESGTGKELIARAIHLNSNRYHKPFVTVNCGALTDELLESELFGHVKGAFTGAVQSRKGRFEIAHQGTIFLDEVGDMSPRLQVKLLRVLQEKKFEPVGMSETISVDVRIIAATHQNLEQAVSESRFREDLYYRLNVIPVVMPALKDRREDIPTLIDYFLKRFNEKKNTKVTGISREAMDALLKYEWPGNVRELENLMERLVILKNEEAISSADLPDRFFSMKAQRDTLRIHLPPEGMDLNAVVGSIEAEIIGQALKRTGGNRNQAARLLNLKRTTLVEKLKRRKKSVDLDN